MMKVSSKIAKSIFEFHGETKSSILIFDSIDECEIF